MLPGLAGEGSDDFRIRDDNLTHFLTQHLKLIFAPVLSAAASSADGVTFSAFRSDNQRALDLPIAEIAVHVDEGP